MSYLSFDLDALKLVPDAARSAGVSEAEFGYGLVRLWSFCWTMKRATVTRPHLLGFFGGDGGRVAAALVAFEFLAPEDDGFRVRGVEKYLRISRAQSDAGKANSGNLKQAREPEESRRGAPGGSPAQPEVSRRSTRSKSPALTASSEQRAANSDQDKLSGSPAQPEVSRQPDLISVPASKPTPAAPSKPWHEGDGNAPALHGYWLKARLRRLEKLEMPATPDKDHPIGFLASNWTALWAAVGGVKDQDEASFDVALEKACDVIETWLESPWAAGLTPPFPLQAFASAKSGWRRTLSESVEAAQ